MVLFGQSAGGQSVDAYSYAYMEDPIVHGFIMQSGSSAPLQSHAGQSLGHGSSTKTELWKRFSQTLGCGDLNCLRSKPVDDILKVAYEQGTKTASTLPSFGLIFDGRTLFNDTDKRSREGRFVKAVSHDIACVSSQI